MSNVAPTSRPSQAAPLAAAIAAICFGASVVATRFAVAQTSPVILAFLRYAIATLCLLVVLRARSWPAMPRDDRWRVGVLGVLFFGVFPWTFSASLTHLPSAHVALVVATTPLVTLALSVARGIERITPRAVVGQLLAFAGLVLALPPLTGAASGATSGLAAGLATGASSGDVWVGYLEITITVLCGAVYNVYSRPLLLRYAPLPITALSMAAGTIALAPLALLQHAAHPLTDITAAGWAAIAFLGTFGGAIGFGLWIWALQRSVPSRVAVFIALNPISAIALGALLLGESVSVRVVLALVAVLAGIQLTTGRRPAS